MKTYRVRILERLLRLLAISIVRKHQPKIIGVTGSVGKSSTKEAIAQVLSGKFRVRKNEENYNNEIGIPLTIIGARSGKRSPVGWLIVLWRWAIARFFLRDYPEVLVLELGIDHPGDMKYLLGFLPVSIGVVTNVSSSHLEFFKSVQAIAREKGLLVTRLPESGAAVLCADDAEVAALSEKVKAKTITFGESETASVRGVHGGISTSAVSFAGCHFKLLYDGKVLPVHMPDIAAIHQIPSVLAAFCVGLIFKLNPIDMIASIREFRSLPGRMRLIEGRKQSWIIDDTYNASPLSTNAALETLHSFQNGRRIAILGDMLELGRESEHAHEATAERIIRCEVDRAVLVGRRMLSTYETLTKKKHFPEARAAWFDHPQAAAAFVRDTIDGAPGDIVLVKGSQGMRMEMVTEALMAHPEQAENLLCRQSADWKSQPFTHGYGMKETGSRSKTPRIPTTPTSSSKPSNSPLPGASKPTHTV
jgi:UDP-N-acetylmuramyl pentapeptide synthase